MKQVLRLVFVLGLLAMLVALTPAQEEDYYYIDCTVEFDDAECEWFWEWDGEEALPDWYVEDVILLDCGFDGQDEACNWAPEDWYSDVGDGLLAILDFGEEGYIVLFEPGVEAFGEGFSADFGDEEFSFEDSDSDLAYSVDSDQIFDPVSFTGEIDPNLEGAAAEIWSYVTNLIPPDWLSLISRFELFTNDDETAAYVYPDENAPGQWVLGVNPIGLEDPAELESTLVHELGHIITLHNGQVDPGAGSCSTLEIEEGCAFPASYLNAFYQQFWIDLDAEHQQIMQMGEGDQMDALEGFYREYRDQFVSDYAATNIVEDMAESFMFFVTGEENMGGNIAEQKVQFFANYSELVELRDYIRQGLGG
jgi:hypothetical protein